MTFWADPAIFETTTYSFETISRRLQEMAFLNKGLTIVLRDERADQVVDEDDARRRPSAASRSRKRSPTTTPGASPTSSGTSTRPKDAIHKSVIYFE